MPIRSYITWQGLLNRYDFASKLVKDKVVLDIGCARGDGASYLLKKGANKVIAGDISEVALKHGKRRYQQEGLEFVQLSATELPFPDECFDAVAAFEVIEHLKDYRRLLSECRRVLKKGCPFVCSTPNVDCRPLLVGYRSGHIHEFHPQEFHGTLSEYFTGVTVYGRVQATLKWRIERALTVVGGSVLSNTPGGEKVKNLVTRFIFRRYREAEMGKIEDLGEEFELIPQKSLSKAVYLLAAAKRSDAQ